MENKLILKLTRVNKDGTKETLCNQELSSVTVLGECYENPNKLLELIAQTSLKKMAANMAQTQNIIKAAKLAVLYGQIMKFVSPSDDTDDEDPEDKLAELIDGKDEE